VNVESFYHKSPAGYYLVVSEFVAYKRIADAVSCCSRTGRKLKVVGAGPEYRELRKLANSNVEFCGRVSDRELRNLYAQSRAVLIPGEEDFGMVAVEAMASGKPVVALGKGGVLESVPPGYPLAGFFYSDPGPQGMESALLEFERKEGLIVPSGMQAHATNFSPTRFKAEMKEVLWAEKPGRPGVNIAGAA
jgi:glycosyltransferase involved in cell wall biosynthesis